MRFWPWLCCMFLPMAALSQPIAVQTGEHASFTRVVLTIPTGATWQLGRNDAGYVVRLPVEDGYDLSRFYDLIPRERITNVTQDPDRGELLLGVSCPCAADAFLYRSNFLVIDIRDGAAEEGSPFETALNDGVLAERQVASPPLYQVRPNPLLPLVISSAAKQPADVAMPVQPQTAPVSGSTAPEQPGPSSLDDDLAVLERSVAESLARGLSQGLLEPELPRAADAPQPDKAILDALAQAGFSPPGITARTSVDSNAIPDTPAVAVTQSGDRCLPDSFFDVANWGDDRPYFVQIGDARAQLFDERDNIEETAVVALARRYVFFGFGREAMQTLALDGVQSQERIYLTALAQIIDGETVTPDLFAQQVSCDGFVAFWAMLSRTQGAQDAQVARPAVLRTFKTLPGRLQSHLGPRLAERFTAIGDLDGATQALAVLRADPNRPIEATLAETALAQAMGQSEQATEMLAELADDSARMTPEAMTTFLTEAVQNDMFLGTDDFLLADALRFENALLPVANDLAVAQIRAYLHQDRFDDAISLLKEEAGPIGPERHSALKDELANAAVARMGSADFLRLAFEVDHRPETALTQNAMARRVLDLGFPEAAQDILTGQALGEPGIERQLLMAETWLALNDPASAEAALSGLEGEKAEGLRRISAELRSGIRVMPVIGAATETDNDLWRRGDWRDLVQSDDPLLQAASEAVLEDEILALDSETPLASGRALLDRAARSRGVVEDLLDRFEAPEDL